MDWIVTIGMPVLGVANSVIIGGVFAAAIILLILYSCAWVSGKETRAQDRQKHDDADHQ